MTLYHVILRTIPPHPECPRSVRPEQVYPIFGKAEADAKAQWLRDRWPGAPITIRRVPAYERHPVISPWE